MAKKKKKQSSHKSFILPLIIGIIVLIVSVVLVLSSRENQGDTAASARQVARSANQGRPVSNEQLAEFSKQTFENTYKNKAVINENGDVTIPELKIKFPKTNEHEIAYTYNAKVDGVPVGASVADWKLVNSLFDEASGKSIDQANNCYGGLFIVTYTDPNAGGIFKKVLADGRYYSISYGKSECKIYENNGFIDYLKQAESI